MTVEGNIGLPLGENGFINISGQYGDFRSHQPFAAVRHRYPAIRPDPFAGSWEHGYRPGFRHPVFRPDAFTNTYSATGQLLQSVLGSDGLPDDLDNRYDANFNTIGGSSPFSSPEQIWGQPEQEQVLIFVNAALPITDELELYGHGNYSEKEVAGGFFHRRPGVSQLLPLRLQDGTIYNPRDTLYPSGFTPQFSGEVFDFGGAFGVRGTLDNGLDMDLSFAFGENEIQYTIANTMNPSLGPATNSRSAPVISSPTSGRSTATSVTASTSASRPISTSHSASNTAKRTTRSPRVTCSPTPPVTSRVRIRSVSVTTTAPRRRPALRRPPTASIALSPVIRSTTQFRSARTASRGTAGLHVR